ncbi:MAG TPA: MoaD/ThiS family protein [Candidatus Bathyarchaeota archaeon]|nr:MoaD/ThiS family protein [Candidatus Bathyarchaeota archaeon]
MIRVRICYFAGFREAIGRAEEVFHVEEGTTLRRLLFDLLPEKHPRAREKIAELLGIQGPGRAGRYLILVNGRSHALLPGQMDYELRDGDVITLFPPLGGG